VNDTPFLGAAPGTVLFLGAKLTRQFQFLETGGFWEIRYSFLETTRLLKDDVTKVGWNYAFRRTSTAAEENWTPLKAANSSPAVPPYLAGSMGQLFEFG
jgi:hypothetical protein